MPDARSITMVLCIRLHDGNPWVLERLELLLGYYDPRPEVLVLDFGSDQQYADEIRARCERNAHYIYYNDKLTYSASLARNVAASYVDTDYIFFCDIDCIAERDIFFRFANYISSSKEIESSTYILPVYHLSSDSTDTLLNLRGDAKLFNRSLIYHFNKSLMKSFDADRSYVAPYSNVFLIHREIFKRSGEYDVRFRGHGSEDFEFLLRLSLILNLVPRAKDLERDVYGPLTDEFFDITPYKGFRRYLEAAAIPAELAGFRVAHLAHPRSMAQDWHNNNDSKRKVFKTVISEYLENYKGHSCSTFDSNSYLEYKANIYKEKELIYILSAEESYEDLENAGIKELNSGNYNLALKCFDRSFELNSERVTPLLLAADCCSILGKTSEAISHLKKASRLRANSKKIKRKMILAQIRYYMELPRVLVTGRKSRLPMR